MQVIDWKMIIEEHGATVWRISYRLLGNYTDASDCFQETFISALEFSRYNRIKSFSAFLARLATARAIDQLRLRFRQKQNNTILSDMDNYSIEKVNPVNHAQQAELAVKLRYALAQLSPPEAQVFCLRYLNDMSYRRIAKELSIKTNKVGVLLHRAKEKMRKYFEVSSNHPKSEVVL